MKRNIKHKFVHKDPEKTAPKIKSSDKSKGVYDLSDTDNYLLIKKDLKKTVIIIILFLITIAAVYLIQEKTSLLKPILSKFSL